MSDALAYLVKVRPEAMTSYFAFLKDAGSRLDPKTRNLISVITKVHSRTEAGLRQYLKRALREGATAEEVVDALLMAFPALGLANIIWAIDVILKMDLPEFRLEELAAAAAAAASTAPAWHDVAALADLPVDGVKRLESGERGLFVHRTPSEIRVYDSRCPHQVTNIPELALQGRILTCPKHQWTFDLATGQCIDKGDSPLNRLEHRTTGERLEVFW